MCYLIATQIVLYIKEPILFQYGLWTHIYANFSSFNKSCACLSGLEFTAANIYEIISQPAQLFSNSDRNYTWYTYLLYNIDVSVSFFLSHIVQITTSCWLIPHDLSTVNHISIVKNVRRSKWNCIIISTQKKVTNIGRIEI